MLLGIFALIISVFAFVVAALARHDSKRAADAAEASASEAKLANEFKQAERDELLAERDRLAVTWSLRPIEGSGWQLLNTGTERAIDVQITGDGVIPGDSMKDVIAPGVRLLLPFPGLRPRTGRHCYLAA